MPTGVEAIGLYEVGCAVGLLDEFDLVRTTNGRTLPLASDSVYAIMKRGVIAVLTE